MTAPFAAAPGACSCMRLRQRRNVDLPQPDGPITAVTLAVGDVQGDVVDGVELVEVGVEPRDR